MGKTVVTLTPKSFRQTGISFPCKRCGIDCLVDDVVVRVVSNKRRKYYHKKCYDSTEQ